VILDNSVDKPAAIVTVSTVAGGLKPQATRDGVSPNSFTSPDSVTITATYAIVKQIDSPCYYFLSVFSY
jgi:hypothetical protein